MKLRDLIRVLQHHSLDSEVMVLDANSDPTPVCGVARCEEENEIIICDEETIEAFSG